MLDGLDMEDIPGLTTLPMEQASDFMANMALAAKDGNLADWLESVDKDHLQNVCATVKDMEVVATTYAYPLPEVMEAAQCFQRQIAACERDGKPISEAVICAPCANQLSMSLAKAQEYMRENATPQIQKLLTYAQDLKKQAIAKAPEMMEALAQAMSNELGIDIEEARKQVGLSPDGKTMLNQPEGDKDEDKKDSGSGWTSGLGD